MDGPFIATCTALNPRKRYLKRVLIHSMHVLGRGGGRVGRGTTAGWIHVLKKLIHFNWSSHHEGRSNSPLS